jgi:MFS family permease
MAGRRFTISVGMLFTAATAVVCPFTSPSVYPWYFLNRVVFGMMYYGVSCNPYLVDVVQPNSRGTAQAVDSLLLIGANYLGTGVLFNYTKELKLEYSFFICAGVLLFFTIFTFLMIKESKSSKPKHSDRET